jgi:D-methionine transport system permease protein
MELGVLLQRLFKEAALTLYMVGVSTVFTVLFGLPLGVWLVTSAKDGLRPQPMLNRVLGFIVNVGRSLPFIILLLVLIPFTRAIVGTAIGSTAAIVPLTIAAIPFFARLAETSLREVDPGLVDAAQSMGASKWQVVSKVLIPEALPSLVLAVAITIISLISYSAMAGAVGGGGLGDLAVRYGYQRYQTEVMIATVIFLVLLVQLIQAVFAWLADRIKYHQ